MAIPSPAPSVDLAHQNRETLAADDLGRALPFIADLRSVTLLSFGLHWLAFARVAGETAPLGHAATGEEAHGGQAVFLQLIGLSHALLLVGILQHIERLLLFAVFRNKTFAVEEILNAWQGTTR